MRSVFPTCHSGALDQEDPSAWHQTNLAGPNHKTGCTLQNHRHTLLQIISSLFNSTIVLFLSLFSVLSSTSDSPSVDSSSLTAGDFIHHLIKSIGKKIVSCYFPIDFNVR